MESITVTIRHYRHCFVMYNLDDAAMAKNFASPLLDSACAFFLEAVQPGMTFDKIKFFMLAEFNSTSRQIQIRRKLNALRIELIIREKSLTCEGKL